MDTWRDERGSGNAASLLTWLRSHPEECPLYLPDVHRPARVARTEYDRANACIRVRQVDSRCDGCMSPLRAGSLLVGRNLAIQTSTASRSTSRSSASNRTYSTGVSGRIITFGVTMSDADVECAMHEFALGLPQGWYSAFTTANILNPIPVPSAASFYVPILPGLQ